MSMRMRMNERKKLIDKIRVVRRKRKKTIVEYVFVWKMKLKNCQRKFGAISSSDGKIKYYIHLLYYSKNDRCKTANVNKTVVKGVVEWSYAKMLSTKLILAELVNFERKTNKK